MAKSLTEWVETDVKRVKDQPLKWLSEDHFFRDPNRPMYSDNGYLFSPADGIIIYQQRVQPTECLVEIKANPIHCSRRSRMKRSTSRASSSASS